MKVLVGAACIAIIAAVGYFFWSEYADRRDAETRAAVAEVRAAATRQESDIARTNLFRLADAAAGEDGKVRSYCRNIDRGWVFFEEGTEKQYILRWCRELGIY